MASELKQDTEGADSNKIQTNLLKLSNPVSLIGICDESIVGVCLSDNTITGKRNMWMTVGLNHEINPKQTTIIEAMSIVPRKTDKASHWALGFAVKEVIDSIGIAHHGAYINGVGYRSNGQMWLSGNHIKTSKPVALSQKLTFKIEKCRVSISVENHEIWTVNAADIFLKNEKKAFYPCISFHGENTKMQIIELKVK